MVDPRQAQIHRWSDSTPRTSRIAVVASFVDGVAAGFAVGVDPLRWGEFGDAVGGGDVPVGVVDEAVVGCAEQDEVVGVGGVAVGPVAQCRLVCGEAEEVDLWRFVVSDDLVVLVFDGP